MKNNIKKQNDWKDNFQFYDLHKNCPAGLPVNAIDLCTMFQNLETNEVWVSVKSKLIPQMIEPALKKVPQCDLREYIAKHVRFKLNLDEMSKGFILSTNCDDEEFERLQAKYPCIKSKHVLNLMVAKILEEPFNEFIDYMNSCEKTTKSTFNYSTTNNEELPAGMTKENWDKLQTFLW